MYSSNRGSSKGSRVLGSDRRDDAPKFESRREMKGRCERSSGEITMTGTRVWIIAVLMAVFIPGCKDRNPPAEGASNSRTPPPQPLTSTSGVADQWLGKWV